VHRAAIGLILTIASFGWGADVRYVATREVLLAYATANPAPVEQVDLWVTRDGGKTWSREPGRPCGRQTLAFQAPADGWYGFYLVLHNSAGVSADPPAAGTEPHSMAIVDTVAPVLQLHRGSEPPRIVAGCPFSLRLSLIDEHLGPRPLRAFTRTHGEETWVDGGWADLDGPELTWSAPADLAGPVDLRIVATDLAGNRALDDLLDVPVEAPPPPPGAEPPTETPTPAPPTESCPTSAGSAPAETPENLNPASARRRYAPGEFDKLNELRNLSDKLGATGNYAQAAEALRQAVEMWPDDPDLLASLAEAVYSDGRHDEAEHWFSTAIAADPDHFRALEGLALVAATKRRYPQAAAHLEHLLRLQPNSAQIWLRYGDVEHKLGEKSRALEAWERVISLRDADPAVRQSAERRLRYFQPPLLRP